MTCEVLVHVAAQKQVIRADTWWRKNRPKNPELFAAELEHAYALIGEVPGAGLLVRTRQRTVRRFLMSATRYHIYYEHFPTDTRVVVLAVWSAIRKGPISLPRYHG